MSEQTMKVTSIEQLREYQKGMVVELPPFAEGQEFIARIKRPSMLQMVKTGQIPNELLVSANKLFAQGSGSFDEENKDAMKEMFNVFDRICEATFVQPTYSELVDNGITLTDDQYMFIFNYVQNGVKALDSFR